MGHTVYPMRWVVYDKIAQLRKLSKGLREPERTAAESLIYHIYQNISTITYANPMPAEIEENMVFVMLLQEKLKGGSGIDDLTLLLFSLIVIHRCNSLNKPNKPDRLNSHDDWNPHRLLQRLEHNSTLDKDRKR